MKNFVCGDDYRPLIQNGVFEAQCIKYDSKFVLGKTRKVFLTFRILEHSEHNGKEIFISLSKNDNKNEIEFKVENVGIGIPKNQQKRIFTKFFRAENAVKAETVGSGLGLFINKNIIKSHKGRIWFESEKNKKTAFYFTIPVKSLNK